MKILKKSDKEKTCKKAKITVNNEIVNQKDFVFKLFFLFS